MSSSRRPRALSIWIATLALLMAALMPTLAKAWRADARASLVEVCSASGSKWVAADTDGGQGDSAPTQQHAAEHCAWCALHTDTLAPPPAALRWLPSTTLGDVLPPAFLAAPRTLHAWASAQPRAPPTLS